MPANNVPFLSDSSITSSMFMNTPDPLSKNSAKYSCLKMWSGRVRLAASISEGSIKGLSYDEKVNEKDEEIYCERWRHMEWSKMIANMVEQLNKYKPYTLIEANGAQDAIYEQIRNAVNYPKNKIQPFVTGTKNKVAIIEDLIVKFEEKDLKIIGHDWQVGELQSFTYEYNVKTRAIKYSAPTGLHDDYVMSRAICSHAHKTMKKKGHYSFG